MNTNKIDLLKDALSTSYVQLGGWSIYTPDGQPEGIITIEFKKWTGHAQVEYFQVSIPFNDARKLSTQLEEILKKVDADLFTMKEARNV